MQKIKRIILLDPNLKSNFGHPMETAESFVRHKDKLKNTNLIIIANKEVDQNVVNKLGTVYPLISNTCFQNLEDQGLQFSKDLFNIDNKIKLSPEDLVFIPTAYSNEIIGLGDFLSKTNIKSSFSLQIHQFFPPSQIFEDTLTSEYFKKHKALLSNAFAVINNYKHQVKIWSTESIKLNKLLNTISPFKINQLTLPIETYDFAEIDSRCNSLIFVGDGRYEKGLFLLLNALRKVRLADINVYIQNYKARGYKESDLEKYNNIIKEMKNNTNINFIKDMLDGIDFHKLISKAKLVVLPYSPLSYDKRISEVYILAKIYKKVCIVSSNTWMAEESQKYGSDIIFSYFNDNFDKTGDNLAQVIQENILTENNLSSPLQSVDYKQRNDVNYVLETIQNSYENN